MSEQDGMAGQAAEGDDTQRHIRFNTDDDTQGHVARLDTDDNDDTQGHVARLDTDDNDDTKRGIHH